MNTDNIESLDSEVNSNTIPDNNIMNPESAASNVSSETNTNSNAMPIAETIPEMTPVENAMPNVMEGSANQPNLGDMVSPTNLASTDISKFGQEGIPLNNINQNPKPSTLQNVTKSDEFNNIGSVPENAHVEQSPKRQLNIKFILFLAIVLIGLIGGGVFFYLRMGNKKATNLKVKNVKLQLGESLSTNLSDFVVSGKIDSSCVPNFDSVQENKIGTYEYKVVCNNATAKGEIKVVDELAPEAIINIAFKVLGDELTANDFVESCEDPSGCISTIVDEDNIKNSINTPGVYDVVINVKDDKGNTKDISTYLVITNTQITRHMNCSSKELGEDDNYKYIIKDSLGIIIANGTISSAGFTVRDYIITYSNEEEYKKQKDSINAESILDVGFVSGKASYDDANKQITIKKMMSIDELNEEFGSYPESYNELRSIYENNNNEYTCEVISDN